VITTDSIQKVREINILEVVSRYPEVKLDAHGKGCCPFHNEKTASFAVKAKGFFKCFGCGAGGDAIKFVELIDNTDFIGAVERIAILFNIDLQFENNFNKEQVAKQRTEQKSLRDILTEAHKRYCSALWNEIGDNARQYLTEKRGYNEEILSYWQIGFAPDGWRFLTDDFASHGLLPKAVAVGLSKESDKNHYDVYRNRIIFPIVDNNGELVSFGGRALEQDANNPKYINGYNTTLYQKEKVLFGLYQALKGIKQEGYAILTEGYTDVISMHTAGAENTVATCGTALTDSQAILLKRFTSRIVLMRDGDAAGIKATSRDLALLLKHGFKVDVFILPKDKDPDDYAKDYFPSIQNAENERINDQRTLD
jgi:DNA primase